MVYALRLCVVFVFASVIWIEAVCISIISLVSKTEHYNSKCAANFKQIDSIVAHNEFQYRWRSTAKFSDANWLLLVFLVFVFVFFFFLLQSTWAFLFCADCDKYLRNELIFLPIVIKINTRQQNRLSFSHALVKPAISRGKLIRQTEWLSWNLIYIKCDFYRFETITLIQKSKIKWLNISHIARTSHKSLKKLYLYILKWDNEINLLSLITSSWYGADIKKWGSVFEAQSHN